MVLGVSAASQQTLFIVSGSLSNPILGKVTQMLSWGYNSPVFFAALQQTLFIVSGPPSNLNLGEVNQMLSWGYNSPGVSAASQQTLFIVSGSPSNPILGEVNQMLCWGHNSPGGVCCFAVNSFYCLRLPIQSNPRGGKPNTMLGT